MSDPRKINMHQVISEAERPLDPHVSGKTRIAVDVESSIPITVDNTDIVNKLTDIYNAVDGLELSVDNIDLDMEQVEAKLDTVNSNLTDLKNNTDTVEAILQTIEDNTDNIESSIASTNTKLDILIADLVGNDTATSSNISVLTTSTTVLASNSARKMAMLTNDSVGTVYVKFGAAASTTSYGFQLGSGDFYELPTPVYKGIITAITVGTTKTLRVTEY